MTEPALLRAEGARIEASGSLLLEGLTFEASGSVVALVGAWEPLFRLWSRDAILARGTLTVSGERPENAVPSGCLGLSAAEGALPIAGTALDFLASGARLTGIDLGRRRARKRARAVLARLGASALEERPMSGLNATERKALGVVHAVLGEPRVIALERPLEGMSGAAAESLATLVARAAEGRRLVFTAGSPAAFGPETDLVRRADTVVVLSSGAVAATGAPSEVLAVGSRYVVHTLRAREALRAALAERGIAAERLPGDASPEVADDEGRLVVHLPRGGDTRPIVDAALAVGAPIVELLPVGLVGVGARERDPLTPEPPAPNRDAP